MPPGRAGVGAYEKQERIPEPHEVAEPHEGPRGQSRRALALIEKAVNEVALARDRAPSAVVDTCAAHAVVNDRVGEYP